MDDVPITRANGNNPAGNSSTVPASTPPTSSSPPPPSDALEGTRAPASQPQAGSTAEGPRPNAGPEASPEASHTIDSGFNPNLTDGAETQNYLQQFLDAQNTAPDIREEAQRLDNELNQMLNQGPPSTPEEVASRTRQLQDWNTRAMQLVQTQANHDRELAERHEAKSSAREEQRSEQKFRASEDLTRYVEAKNKRVEAGIPNGNKYKPLQMAAKEGREFASQVRQDLRAEERYREDVRVSGKAKDFQSLLNGGKKPQGGLASGKGNPPSAKGENFIRDGKLIQKNEPEAEPASTEVAEEGGEEGDTPKTGKQAKPAGKPEPKLAQKGKEVCVAEGESPEELVTSEEPEENVCKPKVPTKESLACSEVVVRAVLSDATCDERLSRSKNCKEIKTKANAPLQCLASLGDQAQSAEEAGKPEQALFNGARHLVGSHAETSKRYELDDLLGGRSSSGDGAVRGLYVCDSRVRQILDSAGREVDATELFAESDKAAEIQSAVPGDAKFAKNQSKLHGILSTEKKQVFRPDIGDLKESFGYLVAWQPPSNRIENGIHYAADYAHKDSSPA